MRVQPVIPPVPIPFDGPPRLTLMFHVWPYGDGWKRHVGKLQPVIHRFDRKILGIAVDSSTASAAEVIEAFGGGWEIVEVANNPDPRRGLREVETYQKMLPMLDTGMNDIAVCAHAKGVQDHTAESEPVTWWIDAMYQTVIYNLDGVIAAIRDGAAVTGSFRRHGGSLGVRNGYHFSGTYYAFRSCIAMNNGLPTYRQKWWGTESWPGDYFPLSASHCLFGDHIGDPYRAEQQPREALVEWRKQHASRT